MKKIIICIVAYNAESTLRKVLDRIPAEVKAKVSEVVVFDDESPDSTYKVASEYRKDNPQFENLTIYRNPRNLGYGGNQKRCYRYCIEKGYDIAVLLHGDGQYAPEALPKLLEPLERGEADAVFGSRMMEKGAALKGHMPFYKYVGNKILTAYENMMLGMDLTEFHSGYRLYSVDALKKVPFENNTDDFHFDTEIIAQFHARGLKIKEVAIPTYYGDEICHVNGLKYAFNVARVVLQYKLHEFGFRQYPKYAVDRPVYRFKRDWHSSHLQVARMIPDSGQFILDVGCGPSDLSRLLKKSGNEIVGVDRMWEDGSGEVLTRMIDRDLEEGLKLDYGREFDYVLLLDILEHMREPEKLLNEVRAYLKPGGKIIVSIPNVAHWSVRLSLLFGRFNYGVRGILDRTHLHFYTLKSFRQLLKDCNYRTTREGGTPLPLIDLLPIFGYFPFRLIHWVDVLLVFIRRPLFAYQLLFVAEDAFSGDYRAN